MSCHVDRHVLPDVRKYSRTRSTTTNVNKYIANKLQVYYLPEICSR